MIDALTHARDEAERANSAKSTFLATMSHEIRTPMNGVVGLIEVLENSPLNEQQTRLLGTIRESANSLLTLIDDILDFSKIEAGRLELESQPFNLVELIENLCSSLVPVAHQRDVDLSLFIDPDLPAWVLSDPVRLRQLLYNLIGNGIKFCSGREGIKGRVSVRVGFSDTDPLQLKVRVADNGIGISAEQQKLLFAPFTQAESSTTRRFGGTGLGLVICKHLVDLMGGGIRLISEPWEPYSFWGCRCIRPPRRKMKPPCPIWQASTACCWTAAITTATTCVAIWNMPVPGLSSCSGSTRYRPRPNHPTPPAY
jgi:signal transduction histidine kinase